MNYSACFRVHALVSRAEELRKEAGFWDGVGSFARGGMNAVKGFGSALGNAATAIPQTLMSAGKGFLTGEGGGLMGGMRDVGGKIQSGFSQGLQGMGQMARPAVGAAQSMGQGVAAAGQALGNAADTTGAALSTAAGAAGQQLQQAGSGIWQDIMKGWNGGQAAPAATPNAAAAGAQAAVSPTGAAPMPGATGPGIPAPGQAPAGTTYDQSAVNQVSSVPRAQAVAPWEDPRFYGAF